MPAMDSDTSDSDDDLERREGLKRRQREFAAKRAAKSSGVEQELVDSESTVEPVPLRPSCCQLVVEDDFDEYLGLADAFRERKFVVVGPDMTPLKGCAGEETGGPFVPDVQWCSYKKVAWSAVMKGQVRCLPPPACLCGHRRQPGRATAERRDRARERNGAREREKPSEREEERACEVGMLRVETAERSS